MDTTKRRLDSASILFAYSSPSEARCAYSNSSSDVNKLMRPISFKYILTGSLILTSLERVKSSTSKLSGVKISLLSVSSSSSALISILFSTNALYRSSKVSLSISNPFNSSAICSYVILPSCFFPNSINAFFLSSIVLISVVILFNSHF